MLGMVPVPAEVGTLALFFGQSGNLSINYTVMLSLHEPIFLKQNHVFIFNIAQKVKYINLNCEMIIHLAAKKLSQFQMGLLTYIGKM